MEQENLSKNAFRAFSRLANAGRGDDLEKFVKSVTSDHRTLQQCMFRMMCKCFQEWAAAKESGMFDLRNEDTVNQCAEIVEKVENFGWARMV